MATWTTDSYFFGRLASKGTSLSAHSYRPAVQEAVRALTFTGNGQFIIEAIASGYPALSVKGAGRHGSEIDLTEASLKKLHQDVVVRQSFDGQSTITRSIHIAGEQVFVHEEEINHEHYENTLEKFLGRTPEEEDFFMRLWKQMRSEHEAWLASRDMTEAGVN